MFRWHVVSAIFNRNLKKFFSGPLGYLLVIVFVGVAAILAFRARFFAVNLANLDQLTQYFSILLLLYIPAITMSIWADEKKAGTDSILFTLPASDFEILLGKYLSVAAVYTLSLLFSTTLLVAISTVGSPDWGVATATYIGYWIAGLALLAIGMFASSLTEDTTIAFILGAALCAIPIFIGKFLRSFVIFEQLGVDWHLYDFTVGLVSLPSVIYFASIGAFFLFLNLVVIGNRHWNSGERANMGMQFFVRGLAMAVAFIAANVIFWFVGSQFGARADLTKEKLYTLDETTLATLQDAKDNDRKVTIQAFVSRDVPRKYINTKNQFLGLLRQYNANGGAHVDVQLVEVEPFSEAEAVAQKQGILPIDDRSEVDGVQVEQKVYMGASISSSLGDVKLPFIENKTSIEYELSRAIATTTNEDHQMTIGILDTDARFGGPEIEGRRLEWAYNSTLEQLKKQYKIKQLPMDTLARYLPKDESKDKNPDSPDPADPTAGDGEEEADKPKTPPDVLIVADPSSLSEPAMDDLIKYIQAGNPVVMLADPLPFFWTFQNPEGIGIINAPNLPRISPQSPYQQLLASSFLPKADGGKASKLMSALGIEWDNGSSAWSLHNPHSDFSGSWAEQFMGSTWPEAYGPYEKALMWVSQAGDHQPFNQDNKISSGLKELLFFYPGHVRASADAKTKFIPLVTTDEQSGATPWEQLTKNLIRRRPTINPRTGQREISESPARSQITGENQVVVNPTPETYLDDGEYTIAAQIKGEGDDKTNVVFIADSDFVSDLYFDQERALKQPLDNVALLQNAIDVLAGRVGFVNLRNRRPSPKTLTSVETQKNLYRTERTKKQEEAEKEVRKKLEEAQAKLNVAAEEIGSDESLSFIEKLQKTSQEASDAQRMFNIQKKKLDKELKVKIEDLKRQERKKITYHEEKIRWLALLLSILPALILGTIVFFMRSMKEKTSIDPDRRL